MTFVVPSIFYELHIQVTYRLTKGLLNIYFQELSVLLIDVPGYLLGYLTAYLPVYLSVLLDYLPFVLLCALFVVLQYPP